MRSEADFKEVDGCEGDGEILAFVHVASNVFQESSSGGGLLPEVLDMAG